MSVAVFKKLMFKAMGMHKIILRENRTERKGLWGKALGTAIVREVRLGRRLTSRGVKRQGVGSTQGEHCRSRRGQPWMAS